MSSVSRHSARICATIRGLRAAMLRGSRAPLNSSVRRHAATGLTATLLLSALVLVRDAHPSDPPECQPTVTLASIVAKAPVILIAKITSVEPDAARLGKTIRNKIRRFVEDIRGTSHHELHTVESDTEDWLKMKRLVRFQLIEVVKGRTEARRAITGWAAFDCGVPFAVGEEYVILGMPVTVRGEKAIYTDLTMASTRVSESEALLKLARAADRKGGV